MNFCTKVTIFYCKLIYSIYSTYTISRGYRNEYSFTITNWFIGVYFTGAMVIISYIYGQFSETHIHSQRIQSVTSRNDNLYLLVKFTSKPEWRPWHTLNEKTFCHVSNVKFFQDNLFFGKYSNSLFSFWGVSAFKCFKIITISIHAVLSCVCLIKFKTKQQQNSLRTHTLIILPPFI